MPKSPYATALDIIQKPVTELLYTIGFKKSGRTYNRTVGDGLILVMNFQMGQFPIGNYVIPGIRENLYGKFTVNFGVFLPCVVKMEHGEWAKRICQEYDCEIRARLGELVEKRDVWWSLDKSPQETGELIAKLIEKNGLPFLSRYTDYVSVLSDYRSNGSIFDKNIGRSALVAAMIYYHIGEMESAKECFDRAIHEAVISNNRGFGNHVENIRKQCFQ
jgi:hypothetical protein